MIIVEKYWFGALIFINFVKNVENLSDNEIVSLINSGDYELFKIIINRYRSQILYCVNEYCPESIREDAAQEAVFALWSAVKSFDALRSSFNTFASLCIKRSVLTSFKANNLKRSIPAELLSSINELEIPDVNSPEKIFIDRENYKTLTDTIKVELSSLEYSVLQLYLAGEKYQSIAEKLQIPQKSVDNCLTRIRRKLKVNNG